MIGSQENSVFLHSQLNKNIKKITMLQNRVNILVNTLCRSTVCFESMSYVHTLGIESFGKFKNTFQRTFYRQVGYIRCRYSY